MQSIDKVSSTCSFHRSFNQNGKRSIFRFVFLLSLISKWLISSSLNNKFSPVCEIFDSRIFHSSNFYSFHFDKPRCLLIDVVMDRKLCKVASEKLIDFEGRSRLEEVDMILEKRKFASELNPWLCHASHVSFFSFLVPKNFLSPPPLPLPLPYRMVGCWGHRRRPSRAII